MSMNFPSEPLTSPAWTHKLTVNMTCWPIARRTFNASCLSSMDWWAFWFLCYAKQCAIGILSCFSMCLLCNAIEILVAYMWLECSNEKFYACERDEVVLIIRSGQSSRLGVSFWRFSKSWRKEIWEALSPCCQKMVFSVTKVSNVR